ncbi:MAG: flagellar basal body P-ring protein FlgI [Gemmatimonadota bacterium]
MSSSTGHYTSVLSPPSTRRTWSSARQAMSSRRDPGSSVAMAAPRNEVTRDDTASPRRAGLFAACAALIVTLLVLLLPATAAGQQQTRVADLTIQESSVPVRLVGYGLVVGLDGTGDRPAGGSTGGHTVQSVANLLRRFDVDVPPDVLRMRNVAAVLVTAEVSPYLRPGGRFEVHVSSVGDARSVRGGVLWMTPLISDVGGIPVATAQGPLMISDGGNARGSYVVETTARIPAGGLLESGLPAVEFATASRLLLRQPDLGTAMRVAAAVNAEIGAGTAIVEDPGSVALTLPEDGIERIELLTLVNEIRLETARPTRIVIDSRDGTVVAGGDLAVGAAVVSHGLVTLSIGGDGVGGGGPGDLQVPAGTSAQEIASALHAFQTPPTEIAAIFESLTEIGALSAEIVIR